jgi:hypothetical protein
MSERDQNPPRQRGRRRKDEGQALSQPDQATGAPQQSETPPSGQATPETTVESPVEQITHRFIKGIYKEGVHPLAALAAAQDELFTRAGVVESFQALHSMAGLGIEDAREHNDQVLITELTTKQRAFSSALRRLSPLTQGADVAVGPSDPSHLPPMTGRKG